MWDDNDVLLHKHFDSSILTRPISELSRSHPPAVDIEHGQPRRPRLRHMSQCWRPDAMRTATWTCPLPSEIADAMVSASLFVLPVFSDETKVTTCTCLPCSWYGRSSLTPPLLTGLKSRASCSTQARYQGTLRSFPTISMPCDRGTTRLTYIANNLGLPTPSQCQKAFQPFVPPNNIAG